MFLGITCDAYRIRNPAGIWYTDRMIATNIIDRFLAPFAKLLPAETAQQLVDLKIDEQLQERLDFLADKANRGLLSDSERVEYEE